MLGLLIGLTLLKQFRPYFRKHISNILDRHEYFLLTAIMILCIIIIYILYLILISGTASLEKMVNNVSKVSGLEMCAIFMLSCLTVISGLLIFELDKNHNTPLMNSILLKSFSMIAVVSIGVFIFGERYKMHQVFGVGCILAGIYLASK